MDPLQHCLNYLEKYHVLTLCCSHQQQLWAAHCFYALDTASVSFWLMTDEKTRHAQLMLANPPVTGTVSTQQRSVALLQGIQFAGRIEPLQGDEQGYAAALEAYQQRFPEARTHRATLWQLWVDELKMTDNTVGFASKFHWQRTPSVG